MKAFIKITSIAALICILLSSLTSCAKNEKYEAYDRTGEPYDYYLPDYVKLCDYKGIELPSIVYEPTNQDIDNRLKLLAAYYCDRTEDPDRPCQKYDFVDIVTTCKFKDTGKTYNLFNFVKSEEGIGQTFLLGINHFGFPQLDEAVEGMRQGETKTVTLTLPDPFYKDYLNSGKELEMEIYLNYIDEVEYKGIDDQFYHDHYGYYGDSMRSYINEELRKEFNEYIDGYKVALSWNYICENSKLKKVPEKEYREAYDQKVNSARSTAEKKDMTLLEYVNSIGYQTVDDYYEYVKAYAENHCYEEMLLYYIIRCENLTYTEEFFNQCMLSMAEPYDIKDLTEATEFLKYYMGEEKLHLSVLTQYAQEWVVENAVIREDVNQFFSSKLNK